MSKNPIGIFDSGVGGTTVLKSLQTLLPNEYFIYIADSINAPYGNKTKEDITNLSDKITSFLVEKKCKLIIVACNSATGSAIDFLRDKYEQILFVGLEPAIKPACINTKTNNIGVLATKATLASKHFVNTSSKYNSYVNIHTQIGYKLASKVENLTHLDKEAEELLKKYLQPMIDNNIDYLVLGCTHYPFYYNKIKEILNNVIIIDSGEAVARRTKDLLMSHNLLNTDYSEQKTISYFSTKEINTIKNIISELNINIKSNFNILSF